jgi:SPP1 gp7 family putative phage head morphogenesis protein
VLVNPTRDALQESIDFGGRTALAQMDVGISFDQLDPNVMDWLNANALQHATSVTDTVKEELIVRLMAGVEQGLSAQEIAASFSEFFDGQSQWRALRIARTEVISGYAEGALAGYRQSGLVKMKQWLTAGDGTVDPECLMNEAQGAVPLNSGFASGHSAPPVHCNCRCTLLPVIPENG